MSVTSLRAGLAWAIHVYTASGAVLALLAVRAGLAGGFREAFLWLFAATVVDSTDGWLARRVQVREVLPHIDGSLLDDLVDYATFVFAPAVLVIQADLVPAPVALPIAAAMLISSACGFSHVRAKTVDHYFTGFPSYWNIVVFYLYAAELPPLVGAIVLSGLCVMVFVPIRYVYPSRTPALRSLTLGAGVLWAGTMGYVAWTLPEAPGWLLAVSLLFPAYYVALSFALNVMRHDQC